MYHFSGCFCGCYSPLVCVYWNKSLYKWICTVETGIVQGSAVFVSNYMSPVTLRATPRRTQSDWWPVSEQRSWLWSSPNWWWYLRPAYLAPVEASKTWQNGAQLCLILCSPMDCSLLGSSVHGILQARILEWVVIPFSRGALPIQGLNPGHPHCWCILYQLNYPRSPYKYITMFYLHEFLEEEKPPMNWF